VNPAPISPAKGAQLTDRELIRALRDRIRPAEGDPVDVVDVRSDASDVVKFAHILEDIGSAAARTQQERRGVRAQLDDVAELRKQVESDAFGLLPQEESEALASRLKALEAQSGRQILDPPPPSKGLDGEAAEAAEAKEPAPRLDNHAVVDARLKEVEKQLHTEVRGLDVQEEHIAGRADRLNQAVGGRDEGSIVRLALNTAQRIAAEQNRAITAQTDRLEAKNVGALSRG